MAASNSLVESTALDLLFAEEREEPLDLVNPGGGGRREVGMPAAAFGKALFSKAMHRDRFPLNQ